MTKEMKLLNPDTCPAIPLSSIRRDTDSSLSSRSRPKLLHNLRHFIRQLIRL